MFFHANKNSKDLLIMKNILDLGCGNRKMKGAVGIDINPDTEADVIHDLNQYPYPFEDSTFDEIYADNVIEHLDNVLKVMEELHRISKPGGNIIIKVPYFRSKYASIDPTHRHFFTVESFSYFDPDHIHHKLFPYSKCKYKVKKIIFNENLGQGYIEDLFKEPIVKLCNKYPVFYETYFSHFLPLDQLSFYLTTIKKNELREENSE